MFQKNRTTTSTKKNPFILRTIVILSFFTLNFAYASVDCTGFLTNGSTCFNFYVYGDVDLYKKAFDIAAALISNKVFTTLSTLCICACLMVFTVEILQGRVPLVLALKTRFGVMFLILVLSLLGTKEALPSTVMIIDQRAYFGAENGSTREKVDNVPYLLAIPLSFFSYLEKDLINVVDSVFTDIGATSFSKVGFAQNFADMTNRDKWVKWNKSEEGRAFNQAFFEYMEKCGLKAVSYLKKPKEDYIGEGIITMDKVSPANFIKEGFYRFNDMTVKGVPCTEYWADVETTAKALQSKYKNQIKTSLGIKNDSYLEALDKDFLINLHDSVLGLNGFAALQAQAQLSEVVEQAKYADSLGISGPQAEVIDRNMLNMNARLKSGMGESMIEIFMRKLPTFLNFFEALVLAIFPLFVLSMLITGGHRALMMLAAYTGGLGVVALDRLALAITHDFYTNVTSKNLSQKVMGMASDFVNGGVNTIYDQSYYNYLVERSGALGIASTASIAIITVVVISGTVAIISKIASAHAQSLATQVQDASVLKAQKVESMVQQKMAETTGENPMDMKLKQELMRGIEQNNAAYLDMQKYNQAQQYSAGQIAQGTSQIAAITTMGQDAITNGLGHARALGTDQATKQINAAKGMIDSGVYDSNGNIKNGTQADLYQKGLENQSRIGMNKTIGVGKEDLSGQAGVDKMNAIQYGAHAGVQGEIASGNALKNVYGKDLEGTEQSGGMSYGKASGINATRSNLDSVATAAGTADLMGSNAQDAGYMSKYFKAGRALSSKQMAEKVGQGESAQKQIKDRGLDKLEQTARSLANKQTDEAVGAAEAYDEVTEKGHDTTDIDGNKVHYDADPKAFETGAKIATLAQGESTEKKLEAQKSIMKEEVEKARTSAEAAANKTAVDELKSLNDEMNAKIKETIESDSKKRGYNPEIISASLLANGDLEVKNNLKLDSISSASGAGPFLLMTEHAIAKNATKTITDYWNKNLKENYKSKVDQINQKKLEADNEASIEAKERMSNIEKMNTDSFVSNVSDTYAAAESLMFSQISSNVGIAKDLGILSQNGSITQTGIQMHDVLSANRLGDMMAQKNAASNIGNQQGMINNMINAGASKEEIDSLRSKIGNAAAFAAERKSKFGFDDFKAMVNGRKIVKSMSASGGAFEGGMYKGEHYSINTRTSLTGGYTADMGEAWSGGVAMIGDKLGGIDGMESGMRAWGIGKTVYNGINDFIDTATSFTPRGRIGKAAIRTKNFIRRGKKQTPADNAPKENVPADNAPKENVPANNGGTTSGNIGGNS